MVKSEKKGIVFGAFDSHFDKYGYKGVKSGGDPTYVMKTENYVVTFFINFLDLGGIYISGVSISIANVEENIISLFGKAAIKKRFFYDEKKYFLSTVSDKVNFSMNDPRKLDNEVNLLDFANSYINYYEEKGKHFIEHYSSLPNILKRMNELTLEGKVWQDRGVGILSGALDAQLRGLIIAKLCNDNGLNDKILMCDEILYRDQYKDWLPYYIKLKEQLPSIQPLYNV